MEELCCQCKIGDVLELLGDRSFLLFKLCLDVTLNLEIKE